MEALQTYLKNLSSKDEVISFADARLDYDAQYEALRLEIEVLEFYLPDISRLEEFSLFEKRIKDCMKRSFGSSPELYEEYRNLCNEFERVRDRKGFGVL